MNNKALIVLISLLCFVTVPALTLAQFPDKDDLLKAEETAKTVFVKVLRAGMLVDEGIEFYKANGKYKALKAFSDPNGQFVKDDFYIYVLDLNGKLLAHPKADLVGQDFMLARDDNGKTLVVEIVKTAKEKGSGSLHYTWNNPKTKAAEVKGVYFKKVDDVIICSDF